MLSRCKIYRGLPCHPSIPTQAWNSRALRYSSRALYSKDVRRADNVNHLPRQGSRLRQHRVLTSLSYAVTADKRAITTSANKKSNISSVTIGPSKALEAKFDSQSQTWEIFNTHPGDQPEKNSAIPRVWLRDHCQCSECVHQATRQRQLDVFKINDLAIENCSISERGLQVTWREGQHSSWYPTEFLNTVLNPRDWNASNFPEEEPRIWSTHDGTSIHDQPPEVEHERVMSSQEGLAELTRKIHEYGFCFVDGCPATPEATEELLSRIGPIRNTHYGAFWDFTADLSSKDTAYTNLGLDFHTDTTYFTEPAGLQLFHLLSHDGRGGENQLVDGFRAAYKLKAIKEDYFEILKTTLLHFHASGNEGISIQPQHMVPVFETRETQSGESITMVRWNTYDRTSIPLGEDSSSLGIEEWYKAAKKYHEVLHSGTPDLFYEVQLKPGRPLIFNNWRVLHGRSAFDGMRRMCGGYISMDDFMSRYKTTNYGWEAIVAPGRV